jgi:uncharacterized protein (DUF302 family)
MEAGLFLPCNVIVYENKSGDTVVSAFDPILMVDIIKNDKIKDIALKVQEKLKRVIESV